MSISCIVNIRPHCPKSQTRGQHHEHQLALRDPNHRTATNFLSIIWPSQPRSQNRGQHHEHQLALPEITDAASIMNISWLSRPKAQNSWPCPSHFMCQCETVLFRNQFGVRPAEVNLPSRYILMNYSLNSWYNTPPHDPLQGNLFKLSLHIHSWVSGPALRNSVGAATIRSYSPP